MPCAPRSWALLGLVLSACGSEAPTLAVDDYAPALARAACEHILACCSTDELLAASISDQASCEPILTPSLADLITAFQVSVANGRTEYHADEAQACIDTEKARRCTEGVAPTLRRSLACQGAFAGLVADSGGCREDFECTSGYCEGASDSVDGTCKVLPAAGEPCPDYRCAAELYCEGGGGGVACTARKSDGASCHDADECQSGGCNGITELNPMGACGVSMICDGV